jgi:hypothetical protein
MQMSGRNLHRIRVSGGISSPLPAVWSSFDFAGVFIIICTIIHFFYLSGTLEWPSDVRQAVKFIYQRAARLKELMRNKRTAIDRRQISFSHSFVASIGDQETDSLSTAATAAFIACKGGAFLC